MKSWASSTEQPHTKILGSAAFLQFAHEPRFVLLNATNGRRICIGRYWGTTEEERRRAYPCDDVLAETNEDYYRGVTVFAAPSTLFLWLCQLRIAPYSYDLIDNFGRRSPRKLTQGADLLELGQPFMKIFDLVAFERNVHVTLRLRRPGVFPAMAVSYMIDAKDESECRLLVKLTTQVSTGALAAPVRLFGPWFDWIMMRRQLLNLKQLAERRHGHI